MKYSDEIGKITKGDIVLVTSNNVSTDNGKTWKEVRTLSRISEDESFKGTKIDEGPSLSGFWGNTNEIRSGTYTNYCSRYDGSRWRLII